MNLIPDFLFFYSTEFEFNKTQQFVFQLKIKSFVVCYLKGLQEVFLIRDFLRRDKIKIKRGCRF